MGERVIYTKIIMSTDVPALSSALIQTGLTTLVLADNKQPIEIALDPTSLYVFAFKKCSEEMVRFMASNAGKAANFIALLARPGSGFLSSEDTLGEITLVSDDNLYIRAQTKSIKALEHSM